MEGAGMDAAAGMQNAEAFKIHNLEEMPKINTKALEKSKLKAKIGGKTVEKTLTPKEQESIKTALKALNSKDAGPETIENIMRDLGNCTNERDIVRHIVLLAATKIANERGGSIKEGVRKTIDMGAEDKFQTVSKKQYLQYLQGKPDTFSAKEFVADLVKELKAEHTKSKSFMVKVLETVNRVVHSKTLAGVIDRLIGGKGGDFDFVHEAGQPVRDAGNLGSKNMDAVLSELAELVRTTDDAETKLLAQEALKHLGTYAREDDQRYDIAEEFGTYSKEVTEGLAARRAESGASDVTDVRALVRESVQALTSGGDKEAAFERINEVVRVRNPETNQKIANELLNQAEGLEGSDKGVVLHWASQFVSHFPDNITPEDTTRYWVELGRYYVSEGVNTLEDLESKGLGDREAAIENINVVVRVREPEASNAMLSDLKTAAKEHASEPGVAQWLETWAGFVSTEIGRYPGDAEAAS